MAEGSKDAVILIATSWQALMRAKLGDVSTQICDCTVVLLFAGLFLEANLNYIIEKTNSASRVSAFCGNAPFPGLGDKLAWHYNEYIARTKVNNKRQFFANRGEAKLSRRYPGFSTLYRFRNDLAHGRINRTARALATVRHLRQQAKNMANELYAAAARHQVIIPRDMTYERAIR